MKVKDIMSSEVIYLKSDDTVKDALNKIKEYNINGAPVVNENNDLIGIIVKTDLYRFLINEGHYETYPVNIAMTKEVITIEKEEEIKMAAKSLRDNSINAAPVVEEKKVVGMITLEDIVDWCIRERQQ